MEFANGTLSCADGKMLGFGCMRLPVIDGDKARVDIEATKALFDAFLARGFTYFDTGYIYHEHQSERVLRTVLVERYPRDAFRLATKLPLRDFEDAADMERIFADQLEKCGVDRFDCYLLHNMGGEVYDKCLRYDAFGFVQRKRAEGRADVIGVSFHDSPELLDEILQKHGKGIDFVQLQVNYLDWDDPSIQSRRCYEVARAHGKPVVVMEPVKGGALADVPEEAERLMREAHPDWSPATWALRFAASLPGVVCVLSGMNTMAQVEENCAALDAPAPLSGAERETIVQVVRAFERATSISCTSCDYCAEGCPERIPISRYFSLLNGHDRVTSGQLSYRMRYESLVRGGAAPASACIGCGACERVCPQHLAIRDGLARAVELFEG